MNIFFGFLVLLNIFLPSLQFYDMKYGYIYMNYYNNSDCAGNYNQIKYSIEEDKKIYILNKESVIVSYPYSFDFFSTTVYYSIYENKEEDDEDDKDEYVRKGILCNGLCYSKQYGDDILMGKEIEFPPLYDTEFSQKRYYSCIYNNIIKNATIKIERYTDNSCKTKVQNETNTFYGNESCWNVADNYSFRPLYYEDNNDRIYYHAYNLKGCKSNVFTPFVLNENYFICDSKCRKPKGNETFYYKCDFTAGENLYVLNSLYLYLILYIIIFIF